MAARPRSNRSRSYQQGDLFECKVSHRALGLDIEGEHSIWDGMAGVYIGLEKINRRRFHIMYINGTRIVYADHDMESLFEKH